MSMDSLKATIVEEMESGYRPTYRGHAWDVAQFNDLQAMACALEAAFHLGKAVQFPETRISRWGDALEQLERCKDQAADREGGTAQLPPSG